MADVARAQECHPGYIGACVPVAIDVDCAGRSGYGPENVVGPVAVIGSDVYGLDRDDDGVGCELRGGQRMMAGFMIIA